MNFRSNLPSILTALGALAVPATLPAGLSCAPVNILADGGFERAVGLPPASPEWTGSSTEWGSPVCSVDACGVDGETGPRTGDYWTLFGGTTGSGGESATLTQALVLPLSATVELRFHLRVGAVAAPFTDVLEVRIDGSSLALYTEPGVAEAAYALQVFDLEPWADGALHTLELEFSGPAGGGFAAFNVDDIAIVARQVPTLADGGFEDAIGDPLDSPSWIEASTQFESPLCTLAQCGDGAGSVSPHTGITWAWFGGVGGSTPETSSVSQSVRLPYAAYVDLEFQLGIGAVEAPFTDELYVSMDGTLIGDFTEPFEPETGYSERSLIVDPFADGLPHELRFEYVKGLDGNGANYSLDDIALVEYSCQAILLDGFETHDTSNWTLSTP
jgi:hypothetical protein